MAASSTTLDDRVLNGVRRLPGVTAAYLVNLDAPGPGALASGTDIGAGDEADQAQAALLTAVVSALRQALADLELGQLGDTIIEADHGSVVAGALPDSQAAVVLANAKANVGLIRMELRRLRKQA